MENSWQQVYTHEVPVDSAESIVFEFSGNATSATLFCGANILDQVNIYGQSGGRLDFFAGKPLHCALAESHSVKIVFTSTDPTPPTITCVKSDQTFTWDNVQSMDFGDGQLVYIEDVVRNLNPKNNKLVYSGGNGYGMCSLKYSR